MKVKQALIAVGSNGSRLRRAGVDVPLSKSFLELEGRTMLYWCLLGLYNAGIERVVLAADSSEKIKKSEDVLESFPYRFSRVDFYQDCGLGAPGLPYHTRHLLDERFFFEFGHSMSDPEHYSRMYDASGNNYVVFSAFKPKPHTSRPLVRIRDEGITPIDNSTGASNEFVVCAPCLADQEYAANLPNMGFSTRGIVDFYSRAGTLRLVESNLPIEVDELEELKECMPIYSKYVKGLKIPAETA